MNPPIHLPLGDLAPPPSLFTHRSTLHGQSHVSRVMVHAFRLVAATGWTEEAPRLWAAVFLHDIARTHDGICHRHGGDAMKKLESLPHVRELFGRGGVPEHDYPLIHTAVVHHSLPKELDRTHPHWRLTSLLKDADALDRVRLGDLDPRYLRNPEAREMVDFATTKSRPRDSRLFRNTLRHGGLRSEIRLEETAAPSMKVLVDTSVWSLALRRRTRPNAAVDGHGRRLIRFAAVLPITCTAECHGVAIHKPHECRSPPDDVHTIGDLMSDEDLKAELERLKAENERLKSQRGRSVSLKVSEKGGVSVYGLGRFPVTLYKEQWTKLLSMADEIRAFIKENDAVLKAKPEA